MVVSKVSLARIHMLNGHLARDWEIGSSECAHLYESKVYVYLSIENYETLIFFLVLCHRSLIGSPVDLIF